MGFRDANALGEAARIEADVCIVGAGAAGIALALELDGTPLTVCVLESGGLHYQPAADALDELDSVGLPLNVDWKVRRRGFGGTTEAWFGRCALLDRHDFEPRPWVPDSGWPIPADEIDRFRPAAERLLGVRRPEALEPDFWTGDEVFEALVAGDLSPRVHLLAGAVRLGRVYRRRLSRSRNVTVYLHATVTELVAPADHTRVEHLEARYTLDTSSDRGKQFRVAASAYVLACGGLENPRLLLLSRGQRPAGLGNDHDQVGRYYMNHPRGDGIGRLYLDPRHSMYQRTITTLTMGHERRVRGRMQFAVAPEPDFLRRERLLNVCSFFYGASLERLARLKPSLEAVQAGLARGRLPRGLLGHGLRLAAAAPLLAEAAWNRLLRVPFMIDHLVLVDQIEQVPDAASRITLSDRYDRFGQPLIRLDWRITRDVTRTLRTFYRAFAEHVERRGIGRLESPLLDDESFVPDYTDCAHPMGGTRMHADPRKGVVDTECRVHSLTNLFVAGSSVFPTGGHAAPTLTLVALAIRLGRHLRSSLAAGRLETVSR